jgi:radical SAM protein with 4Fe4S-binding SPASM domain
MMVKYVVQDHSVELHINDKTANMVHFQLNDTVKFPSKITHHKVDELFLVIAEDIPTWIILTDNEFKIFAYLQNEKTLEECFLNSINNDTFSEEKSRNILESVLQKIEKSKFYFDTKTEIMDNAEDIEKNIHVFITHKCNLQCPYCYVSAGQELKSELSINEWKNAFIKLKEGIFELFEYTNNLEFKNLLFTNGLLINQDNIFNIKKYVSLVQISLDGLSPNTHDITRNKGSLKKTLESIKLIIENKIDLDLAINITPNNINEMETELINFLEKLSYKRLNIRLNYHMDREGFAVNLSDDYFTVYQDNREKIKKLIFDLIEKGLYNTSEKEKFKQLRNCGIGLSFGVNSNGEIYPCDKLHKSYGNIKYDNLNIISEEFSKLNEATEIDKMNFCKLCDLRHICNGGCRIDNVIATGSYIMPLYSDDYKLKLYEKMIYKF